MLQESLLFEYQRSKTGFPGQPHFPGTSGLRASIAVWKLLFNTLNRIRWTYDSRCSLCSHSLKRSMQNFSLCFWTAPSHFLHSMLHLFSGWTSC